MAGELLASLDDVNLNLARFNQVADSLDDAMQIDTSRIVKSQLSGVFQPTTLVTWDSPDNTPGLIRSIAGRLLAAKWYSRQRSEDGASAAQYAQTLYNEAVSMLAMIRSGQLVVTDDTDTPIPTEGTVMTEDDFWPNSTTTQGPYIVMGQIWG